MKERRLFSKGEGRRPRGRGGLYLCLSFLIPFFLLFLAAVCMGVTPFGDRSFALTDAKYYLNTLLSLARQLRGEEGVLYSLSLGLGGNAWAQLSWGALTPVSFLALFANIDTIPIWFTWICLVNLSLCGLTMYLLLAEFRGHRWDSLLFSTSYALMGFNAVNCFQTSFLLGPQLLPLMVLGLVRLLRGRSPLLYILSLGACLFINFYFGFHLCVASAVLFLVFLYVHHGKLRRKRLRLTLRWAAASVIAGLLAAPMWLPALKAFTGGGRLDQTAASEYTFTENMPFLQIFSKLFTGANSVLEEVQGLPNIFCGILVVALVILFFMNREIDLRRRRAAGAVLGFYLLTFYLHALTLVMHGGTHTNWFPYRYSYVFSFLLIGLAAEEFSWLPKLTVRETKKCGVILLLASVLVFGTVYEFISGGTVVLDLALLALMWVVWYLRKTRPERFRARWFALLLALLVCGNLFANFMISIQKLQEDAAGWELDLETYRGNTLVAGGLIDGIKNAEEGFFRMEKDFSESASVGADPYLYGYHGVSHSGPTERMFVHKGLNKLGVNWFDMRHWYSGGIPAATDTLLGLKYLLSDRDLEAEKDYQRRVDFDGTDIYYNENALNAAILADAEITAVEPGSDVFKNLNAVWKAMAGGTKAIFTEEKNVTFTLHNAAADQTVTSREILVSASVSASVESERENFVESAEPPKGSYVEYSFPARRDGPVYVFDTSIPESAAGKAEPGIRCCGVYKAGETVTGNFNLEGDYINGDAFREFCSNLVFAYADNDVLEDYAKELNGRDVTFNVVRDSDLTGTFTAEEGRRILFTLPWDEGWTCCIDGEQVPIDKTWDLFMSVEVPAGSHTYEMKFFPAWMDYGLILCGAALAGLAALLILQRKEKTKPAALTEAEAESVTEVEAEAVDDT